jgi:hypothetical protein
MHHTYKLAGRTEREWLDRERELLAHNSELRLREAPRVMAELQSRVAEWVRTRIGEAHMQPRERAMRLLEEAIELAQAEGITEDMVRDQAQHVFSRPAGKPESEAAGVAICLLGWTGATGNSLLGLINAELQRIESKPIDQIRGSLARKADAGLVTTVEEGK